MQRRMERGDGPGDHLWLDATGLGREALERDFPTVTAACRQRGIDPVTEPVPVAPGAHYACGGIEADMDGRTSVAGLFAVGEAASTGVHGANRLASNSLSECFVFARRAAADALGQADSERPPAPPAGAELERLRALPRPPAATRETRAALWRDAGVVRSAEGLQRLLDDPHPLARLIARCALAREESRGAHLRSDRPGLDPALDRLHVRVAADGGTAWERWD
jgi:L-aspartate oxidase